MPCSRTQHCLTRVGLEPPTSGPESETLTTRPQRSPYRGLHYFLIFALKHILLVLVRTASMHKGVKPALHCRHLHGQNVLLHGQNVAQTGCF